MTGTVPHIEWYYGPTVWNPNPGAMWHIGCRDLVGSGHIGEVFIWKDGSVSCTGCNTHTDPPLDDD